MLISKDNSVLLIIDVQENLTPVQESPRGVISGCATLLEVANELSIPSVVAEQDHLVFGQTMIDLRNVLKKDKEFLQSKGIKSLFLFGSFAKGVSRIDSDIDLLFTFNQDKTREELENTITFLKEYYFNKFKRYIDFSEISDYLSDEFIKEINVIKTIFTEENNYE